MKVCKLVLLILTTGLFTSSCNKEAFLSKKPNTSLLVPTTIADFEMLMDHNDMIEGTLLGEVSSDDFYLPDETVWNSLYFIEERYGYIWEKDIYQGKVMIHDWIYPYRQVLTANIVLEGLENLDLQHVSVAERDRIKGWAHYLKGWAYFNLAQLFAPPFDEEKSAVDLGIPLRNESDVALKPKRSTVLETYKEIVRNLELAEQLLPNRPLGTDRNRPYKTAASGLLARVYLSMREYGKANTYAQKTLAMYDKLMDYNDLDSSINYPFDRLNEEVLHMAYYPSSGTQLIGVNRAANTTLIVDSLYRLYDKNDLRKSLFFLISETYNAPSIRATYSGRTSAFGGVATDEIYLIQSECEIRQGNVEAGIETLNRLLRKRWKAGTFVPVDYKDVNDPLGLVLEERRKELVFRGLRWQDLRRLNLEGHNIILRRTVGDREYTLDPNSPRYTMPIPPDEIQFNPMVQNKR